MYSRSTDLVEQVKFIARGIMGTKAYVLEGTVTSVDPTPPCKVRVRLQPYGIETGWLRVAVPCSGSGYGVVLPPPDEGMAVKVIFDMGDIQNGTVIGAVSDGPLPDVEYGTIGLFHESGSSLLIKPDGTVTIKGKNSTQSW